MKYRFPVMSLLFLFIVSCAKPNYQDVAATEQSTQSDCTFFSTSENLCLNLQWIKVPTDSEFGSFSLLFYKKQNPEATVSPAMTPNIALWMPQMSHGSSPVKMEISHSGDYLVTNVFFIMKGLWEIRVQFKDGEKVIEQIVFKYNY